jgi:hypothetical protein
MINYRNSINRSRAITSSPDKDARRKIGVLDKPGSGLSGWKFAALQTVIVSDRCNRESNDLNRRSLLP